MNLSATDSPERSRILEYSRSKFHSEGFYKTSMDEISRELGISKKTIYKHFPSKENLIEEICNCTSLKLTGKINEIVDSDSDVIVKFVRIMNLYSSHMLTISKHWLRDLQIHSPGNAQKIDEKRRAMTNEVLSRLIKQGKKEKLIANLPTPIIINAFIATFTSVLKPEFMAQSKLSLHKAFKDSYDLLLNGMLTEKGKSKLKCTKALLAKQIEI